jgi:thiamine pyrophosphate-dependent acetolactate synthase large subunit-like protein
MKRAEAVKVLVGRLAPDDLVVCCNGMVGRELWTYAERPGNFYMMGSMGLGLGIAIGLALAQPSRRIVALDGDGNVLMGLSTLATAGTEPCGRLLHVVLDNGAHASTGGQRTIARALPLERVALGAGYRSARRVTEREELDAALGELLAELSSPALAGPAMLLVAVEPGNVAGIGRVELGPRELATRFAGEARRPLTEGQRP